MRRRLVAILSVPSLLLCLCIGGLMLRATTTVDVLSRDYWDATRGRQTLVYLGSEYGSIAFSVTVEEYTGSERIAALTASARTVTSYQRWQHRTMPSYRRSPKWLDFYCSQTRYQMAGYSNWAFSFRVPCWLLLVILLLMPACHVRLALRQHHRRNKGLCMNCGYDLRATPERCPECGTAVPPKQPSEAAAS